MISFRRSQLSPAAEDAAVREILQNSLFTPLQDFYSRPRKEFRGHLVYLGFHLISEEEPSPAQKRALDLCAEAVEALHTGSLIVDDIEDQSEWRRGAPTLHLRYGLPQALNAGNWLYFYAFERLRQVEAGSAVKLALYELTERVLLEAHMGQALDVSCQMSAQEAARIPAICRASLELKSGVLMGLGLGLGGIIAEASSSRQAALLQLGIELGVNLQMFDDIGNLKVESAIPKHLEDLRLRRPSYLWWHLAEEAPELLAPFEEACRELPQITKLTALLARSDFVQKGRLNATRFQNDLLHRVETQLSSPPRGLSQLREIAERISHAYS